jgi:HKD family nuclease
LPPSPKEIRCYQLLVKKQLEYFRTPQNNNIIEYLVYTLNSPSTALTDISKTSPGYKYTIYEVAVIQGSLNLTKAALTSNVETAYAVIDPEEVRRYAEDFDKLWSEAIAVKSPEDLKPRQ